MGKVAMLEQELSLNKEIILTIQGKPGKEKEYRDLLIQRSNLKDMLIEAYRASHVSR